MLTFAQLLVTLYAPSSSSSRCCDKPYNNKSDVWALGCVLYELCELKQAFGGSSNLLKTVRRITSGTYEPINVALSPPVHDLVAQCMAGDPDLRPSASTILCNDYIKQCLEHFILKRGSAEMLIMSPIAARGPALLSSSSSGGGGGDGEVVAAGGKGGKGGNGGKGGKGGKGTSDGDSLNLTAGFVLTGTSASMTSPSKTRISSASSSGGGPKSKTLKGRRTTSGRLGLKPRTGSASTLNNTLTRTTAQKGALVGENVRIGAKSAKARRPSATSRKHDLEVLDGGSKGKATAGGGGQHRHRHRHQHQ